MAGCFVRPAVRPQDWPTRLAEFIEERRAMSFAWGTNDCASFACAWVERLYGTDPKAELSIKYRTEREAAKVLKSGGLHAWCCAFRGEPKPGVYARRGDIALGEQNGRDALFVVTGPHIVGPGAEGLVFLPRETARFTWSI